jgi:hypothetical protein
VIASNVLKDFSRRKFLAASAQLATGAAIADELANPTLDIHVHLFGVGEVGTGCRMSETITNGWQFRGLVYLLKLRVEEKPLDGEYERVLAEMVSKSGAVEVRGSRNGERTQLDQERLRIKRGARHGSRERSTRV